jgi:hypothetical protein
MERLRFDYLVKIVQVDTSYRVAMRQGNHGVGWLTDTPGVNWRATEDLRIQFSALFADCFLHNSI